MEVRFFAPGSNVANLGFVEQIFCNKGNPSMHDILDSEPSKFSGVTCLILMASHLTKITKKACGLPKWEDATER